MIELDLPDLLELPELDEEPKWTYRLERQPVPQAM